jgi:hypothetical protein
MTLVCSHCSRANCADARYCYFDGASLLANAEPPATARKTFLAPFVFPTGETCNTYDEFAFGCQRHWNIAVDLLHKGFLQNFFSGLGRLDLAAAAQEAAAFPDRERGLDQFLGRLPTSDISLPKLDVQPKLINLGTLTVGVNSQLELSLENQGRRLIFGSVSSDCKWLAPTETGESKLFQFRDGATLAIQVKGQHLRGSVKPLEATLLVESNAGTFKLKVIASVPIVPFAEGALAGARSPRDIAEKAKAAPKQAAPLFESGAVERWYQANGWTYPVQGPVCNGLAAVQQFFEALGVSKPPKVSISSAVIQLKGKPGAKLHHALQVRTEENRAVYAHAVSTTDWLVVKPAQMQGTAATLPLEINVPSEAGATLQTLLKVTANGQQRFDIPVHLTVEHAHETIRAAAAITAATPAPASPAPIAITNPKSKADVDSADRKAAANPESVAMPTARFDPAKALKHLAPLVLLGLLILGLVSFDAFSDHTQQRVQVREETPEEAVAPTPQEAQFKVAIHDEPDDMPKVIPVARYTIEDEPEVRFAKQPLPPVKVDIKDEPGETGPEAVQISAAPLVRYAVSEPPISFGISCTDAAAGARLKKLTFDVAGRTNSTMVSVSGGKAEFGSTQGRWTRKNQPIDKITPTPGAVNPSHSTWMWGPVAFHQVLEVVPGQAATVGGASRRQLDTVLIRWVLHNTDRGPRSVGLRLQIDTLIGDNDGVPFTVPGHTGLVNTFADFRAAKDVPDFIQALERPNLKNPGTIAHMTLKPGAGIEPASRVSLTQWPGGGGLFGGGGAWNVPVINMGNDSAVVLYWPEKSLKAGEMRTIGFAYGLGTVASNDKLGVTLGGSFEPGQNFTVSAYVENPIAGQTLKLELPAGLRRADGAETQNVAMPAGGNKTSIVTWKVLVERTGEFKLKVNSSTGLSQAKTISIARGEAPTGGKLALDLRGSYEPGEMFTVFGKVTDPLPDQTLTLHLPEGLQKAGGAETQPVPAPLAGLKESGVQWQVKVEKPGKYPLRVSSSTGVAQTKTITIVQPGRAEGAFQILLTGEFAPGKAFFVSTKVVNPAPDQALSLVLPDGLELVVGKETQAALPGALVAWQVKIREAGKFLVGVKSTTGVTQRKTVIIEPPSDQAGRFNFDFAGDIRPGKEFTITAKVNDPLPGQTLVLALPKGLRLMKGDSTQLIAPGKESAVTWNVRVTESGRLPVRIESSTGLARTKTITLSENTLFGN